MTETKLWEPKKSRKLVRPASSVRSMALETEPPVFQNLSDILKALKPGHRRIILKETGWEGEGAHRLIWTS